MFEEIASDYIHKYDALRNLFFELLHFAMKLPFAKFEKRPMNAAQRISNLFLELLERQFPIDENHKELNLRSASDFANQLNVFRRWYSTYWNEKGVIKFSQLETQHVDLALLLNQ